MGKITEITLPKLGESIKEATVLNWLVKEGDIVEKGQALLEVATDKVDSEVPAPLSGKIISLTVRPDEVVKIGQPLGKIEASKEVLSAKNSRQSPVEETPVPNPMPIHTKQEKTTTEKSKKIEGETYTTSFSQRNDNQFYSPLVREIAIKNHISYEELARIPGTGQEGRVRKSDIFNYIKAGRPAQFVQAIPMEPPKEGGFKIPKLNFDRGKGEIKKLDRMGKMIRDHMIYSMIASPHVTAYNEVDMSNMWNWRKAHKEEFQEKYGQKLTFTPLFLEAVSRAIKDFPGINSSLNGDEIIIKEAINIGIGAALPTGNLIVPVVKNADQKDLKTLATEVNELVKRARENKLKVDDTQGGTFTISNVGTFGSLMGTPVINQPQAAILATGVIKKRVEVVEREGEDQIEIRPMMYLCLSFDHSFIEGKLAGSFLKRVAENFENFDVERTV